MSSLPSLTALISSVSSSIIVLFRSGVEFASSVGDVVSEWGFSLVFLPKGLKGGMKFVGTFQGQQQIVGGIVGSHGGCFRQFGAKQVTVLSLFQSVGCSISLSLGNEGLGNLNFFLSFGGTNFGEFSECDVYVDDSESKGAIAQHAVPRCNSGHSVRQSKSDSK